MLVTVHDSALCLRERAALSEALVQPAFVSQADMADLISRDIAFWAPWSAQLDLVQED